MSTLKTQRMESKVKSTTYRNDCIRQDRRTERPEQMLAFQYPQVTVQTHIKNLCRLCTWVPHTTYTGNTSYWELKFKHALCDEHGNLEAVG